LRFQVSRKAGFPILLPLLFKFEPESFCPISYVFLIKIVLPNYKNFFCVKPVLLSAA